MTTGLEDFGIVDDESTTKGDRPADEAAASEDSGRDAYAATRPGVAADGKADPESTHSAVETLRSIGLLAALELRHLQRLAELCDEIPLAKGEHVFRHGEAGEGLYVVLEGAVRISREMPGLGEEALAIVRAGGHFGEMSLLDDGPRSADAIGQESGRLLRLPRHALNELMWKDQDFGYELLWRFVRVLCSRLRESNDRLTMLAMTARF